jgi:hypothetical protein
VLVALVELQPKVEQLIPAVTENKAEILYLQI